MEFSFIFVGTMHRSQNCFYTRLENMLVAVVELEILTKVSMRINFLLELPQMAPKGTAVIVTSTLHSLDTEFFTWSVPIGCHVKWDNLNYGISVNVLPEPA